MQFDLVVYSFVVSRGVAARNLRARQAKRKGRVRQDT